MKSFCLTLLAVAFLGSCALSQQTYYLEDSDVVVGTVDDSGNLNLADEYRQFLESKLGNNAFRAEIYSVESYKRLKIKGTYRDKSIVISSGVFTSALASNGKKTYTCSSGCSDIIPEDYCRCCDCKEKNGHPCFCTCCESGCCTSSMTSGIFGPDERQINNIEVLFPQE